jgi:hypothetical protein
MNKINLNELALKVTAREGLKVSVNNAQVKEVMRCVFIELGKYRGDQILEAVYRTSDVYNDIKRLKK